MKKVLNFFNNINNKNQDIAKIELGPLKMVMKKIYTYNLPHEISLIIPRVEIREKIETPFFTKTKEIVYNSITIVDAPRHPLINESNELKIPTEIKEK